MALTKEGRRKRLSKVLATRILPRIVLVLLCLVYIVPFYQMLTTALKSSQELMASPPTLFPHSFAWRNFPDAVAYIPFLRFFVNSLLLAGGITMGTVASNSLVAYGFSRIDWPGRDKLFYVVVATMFVPYPAIMISLFDIFAKLRWVNTYLPMIVPSFLGQAFSIFLMRQFLMGLPRDISDAAMIDGASELAIFAKIVLPLMKPSIAVVAIFAGVAAWNDFLTPLLYLQSERLYPLAIGLQFFRSQHTIAYSLLMAASTLVVIPVIALFLAFQRFFIEGVTVGSMKG
jgi:multiple sugar transport system permease protein